MSDELDFENIDLSDIFADIPSPAERLKEAMKSDRLFRWGDYPRSWCFFMYLYRPRRWGGDAFTDFVISFKEGAPQALKKATTEFRRALKHVARAYPERTLYLTPIPGHAPKQWRSLPTPLEAVAHELHDPDGRRGVRIVNWSGHLVRDKTIRPAHRSWPERRPTVEEHYETLKYVGNRLSKNAVFVLIDDVYTTGSTAEACRTVLYERTHVRDIVAIFLGKTA